MSSLHRQEIQSSRTPDLLSFEDVSFGYTSEPLFYDVSFGLQPGSFHYLTGASGSGKSTLIRLMYLGTFGYKGVIKLFGQNVQSMPRDMLPGLRQKIGVVFQDFHLIDHLTAVENVSLPLRIQGHSPQVCYERAAEILDWVGLGNALHSKPRTLSGGQQQRVVIGRAVVSNPELILADEPTGNVDDATAIRLMELFESLNEIGTTVVFATHNRDLLREFPHPEFVIKNQELFLRTKRAARLKRPPLADEITSQPYDEDAEDDAWEAYG